MSKYRAMQRAMRRNQNSGETIFRLFYADGSERELRAPGNPRKCLRWLLERMNDPLHADTIAARACESYTSSDGSRILDLVRCSDSADQLQARDSEIAEVTKLRREAEHAALRELGLEPLEEPLPPAPEPQPAEPAPGNVIEMPPSGGVQ
jgi:hypothetical protein